jgi:hypothetical protein
LTDIAAIDRAIRAFVSQPLEEAGRGLFEALGYRSGKTIPLDGAPATFTKASWSAPQRISGSGARCASCSS